MAIATAMVDSLARSSDYAGSMETETHSAQSDSEPHYERIPLVVKVDDLSTQGWVERRDLNQSERMARAGKIFGIFFGGALLTVFVPILHFILPPLLLIIGSVLAFSEYTNKGEMKTGEITCPNCKKLMKLPNEGEGWPRIQRCEGCSFTLTINPAK